MRYNKTESNGYIISVGIGNGGAEITEEEYNAVLQALANKPIPTETTDYALKADLTWEEYSVEPVEDEVDDAEAFEIIFGGEE